MSKFIIEEFDWGEDRRIDFSSSSLSPQKISNWPMVYILRTADGKQLYVGETTGINQRINHEHAKNPDKDIFSKVIIIYSPEFHKSAIRDYENKLINYLDALPYTMTNKNDGEQDSEYYLREYYTEQFPELWEDLKRFDLTKKTLSELQNSEFFKYSPFKKLNEEQHLAKERIFEEIKENDGPVVITGMPGTGKTILGMYLFKALKEEPAFKGMNIKYLVPVPSLRATLQKVAQNVGLNKEDIISASDLTKPEKGFIPGEKGFDILLVDEAHRLSQYKNIPNFGSYKENSKKLGLDYQEDTQVDWIMSQARIPIFFFDKFQIVKKSSPSVQQFRQSIGEAFDNPIELTNQMRVQGGIEYLHYIRDIFDGKDPERRLFPNYSVRIYEKFSDFIQEFENQLEKDSLTRVIAGYSWEWKSKNDKTGEVKDIFIEDHPGLRWNRDIDGWIDRGLKDPDYAREVGYVHKVHGYDLSHAFVIIGKDFIYDSELGAMRADRENFLESNGKRGTDDDELNEYMKNIYYILMTRGIKSTHLYIVDDATREYFKKYFPIV